MKISSAMINCFRTIHRILVCAQLSFDSKFIFIKLFLFSPTLHMLPSAYYFYCCLVPRTGKQPFPSHFTRNFTSTLLGSENFIAFVMSLSSKHFCWSTLLRKRKRKRTLDYERIFIFREKQNKTKTWKQGFNVQNQEELNVLLLLSSCILRDLFTWYVKVDSGSIVTITPGCHLKTYYIATLLLYPQ